MMMKNLRFRGGTGYAKMQPITGTSRRGESCIRPVGITAKEQNKHQRQANTRSHPHEKYVLYT